MTVHQMQMTIICKCHDLFCQLKMIDKESLFGMIYVNKHIVICIQNSFLYSIINNRYLKTIQYCSNIKLLFISK
jgi:hypothetical protein